MKIYFASLTNCIVTVDAWVPDNIMGALILTTLAAYHKDHVVIMRARMKLGKDHESRYIGNAHGVECADFLLRVLHMGKEEEAWIESQRIEQELTSLSGSSTPRSQQS